jgi:hypothetical protein
MCGRFVARREGRRPSDVAVTADDFRAVDWKTFAQHTGRHRLSGLVLSELRSLPSEIWAGEKSTNVLEELRTTARIDAVKAERANATARYVAKILESMGVRHATWKGPGLGTELYGDDALRPSNDIDVIVDPKEVGAAVRVLQESGFVIEPVEVGTAARVMAPGEYHARLTHSSLALTAVELHWRLEPPWFAQITGFECPLHIERAFADPRSGLTRLPRDVEMAALVLHHVKHGWGSLRMALDVALMGFGAGTSPHLQLVPMRMQKNLLRIADAAALAVRKPAHQGSDETVHLYKVWDLGNPFEDANGLVGAARLSDRSLHDMLVYRIRTHFATGVSTRSAYLALRTLVTHIAVLLGRPGSQTHHAVARRLFGS